LKLSFQKLNWINVASLLAVVAIAFAPVLVPSVAQAQQAPIACPSDLGYLCTDGSVASMFRLILNWALTLAFLLAVIFLIYGGFQYIASAGNADMATKGRTTIVNAVIGIVVIVLSYTIVQIVYRFVSGGGSGGITGP
jgi:hypothetical protein